MFVHYKDNDNVYQAGIFQVTSVLIVMLFIIVSSFEPLNVFLYEACGITLSSSQNSCNTQFLDAIPPTPVSGSVSQCSAVGQWFIVLDLEIAIASSSFASLFPMLKLFVFSVYPSQRKRTFERFYLRGLWDNTFLKPKFLQNKKFLWPSFLYSRCTRHSIKGHKSWTLNQKLGIKEK